MSEIPTETLNMKNYRLPSSLPPLVASDLEGGREEEEDMEEEEEKEAKEEEQPEMEKKKKKERGRGQ